MSYKPDEKQWMAYLYGEMDEGDKQAFEKYLEEHPEGRAGLEKWLNLRRVVSRSRLPLTAHCSPARKVAAR